MRAGHHWQAASLEGWKLHHDPNPKDPSQHQPITDNACRDVWKVVAWKIASDKRLMVNERAIYDVLCDMESLLQDAHLWLNDGIAPHLLRCLTHLVLFLRKIGRILQQLEPHFIDILEACVKVRKDRV